MMQTLRKYMKHIFWVVAIAFIATIVFSWGMGGFQNKGVPTEQGIVGIINDQKIQYQQFALAMDQEIENIKQQSNNQELTEYRIQALRNQVWENMVQNILLSQEVKRLKIEATPDEIVFHLRNNPPEFIRSNEQFQTEGQFDMTKYQQALSDPRNYDVWIPIENYLQSTLPLQKLQQYVISTIRVTDREAREAYRLENEKLNAKYIFIDPNMMSLENIEVSDSEVENYYNEHREEYLVPEKRKIEYVLFEYLPSLADSIQTRQDIQDIYDQIIQGADFEELAKESDDSGSKDKGGDLGYFGKGTMVKPFEDAAFSAQVGDVVGPIETQHGLHVIEVLDRKMEDGEIKVHARHILLQYKASPETYDGIMDKSDYLYDEATKTKGQHFAEIAEQEGLTVRETPLFQEGGFVPGIGMSARVQFFAFNEKLNWISQPMRAGENTIVFRISEIQKPHYKPLEDVTSTIENTIQKDKQKSKAGDHCHQVWSKISGGMKFEDAAQQDSLEIFETGLISLQSYISRVGRDAHFSGAAFQLKVGEVSQPVEGTRGYYLINVFQRIDFDEDTYETEKESQKQRLLQQKQQMIMMAYIDNLKEEADIEDYRNQYF